MEEDKVDFVFAPTSTAFLFAAAGVANAHKYILMSAEGGATTLEKEAQGGKLPYFFQGLSYSNHNQMPAFAEICKEKGVKTVSVVYLDDLHGIEYQAQAAVVPGRRGHQDPLEHGDPAGHQGHVQHHQARSRRRTRTSSASSPTRPEHPGHADDDAAQLQSQGRAARPGR